MIHQKRILIACIGNIFLGDDAFGVHVAQRLMQCHFPKSVKVVDFGIRGLALVYALLENWDAAILVDAAPRCQKPGTIYVIEPELPDQSDPAAGGNLVEGHSMDPVKVLRTVCEMGGTLRRILLVGCEPAPLDPNDDMQMELSPQVAAAIEPAVRTVGSLVADIMTESSSPKPEVQHVQQQSAAFNATIGGSAPAH
jgi:hydrogenase maturation protease